MLIPSSYELKDGATAPENTTVKECKYCHTKFAIPNAEAGNYKSDVCEGCKDALDKDVAAASAALMKSQTDAADTIGKALGK